MDDDKDERDSKDAEMGSGGEKEEKKDAKEIKEVRCEVLFMGFGSGISFVRGVLREGHCFVKGACLMDSCAGGGGVGHRLEGEEELQHPG